MTPLSGVPVPLLHAPSPSFLHKKDPSSKNFLPFFTFLSAVQIICFSAYYLAISDKFANFEKVFREIFSPENLEGKKKLPTFAPAIEKQTVLRLQKKSSLKEFHRQRKDVVQEPDGLSSVRVEQKKRTVNR